MTIQEKIQSIMDECDNRCFNLHNQELKAIWIDIARQEIAKTINTNQEN